MNGPNLPPCWTGATAVDSITFFNICDCCLYCAHCPYESRYNALCSVPDENPLGAPKFRVYKFALRRILERREREVAEFVASFTRVKPEMIAFNMYGEPRYAMSQRDVARAKSGGYRVKKGPDLWERKCVNCGALVETCNPERLFCDACHEEIVLRLGFSSYLTERINPKDRPNAFRLHRANLAVSLDGYVAAER